MSTGLPDWSPPVEPEPDRRVAEFVEGQVPDYFQARAIGFEAIEEMERTRRELEVAHDDHAAAEVEYRKLKFRVAIEARNLKVDGKRLTELERRLWTDEATVDAKAKVARAWGLVESARAAVTIADRRNATVRQFTNWAMNLWMRDAG